MEIVSLTCTGCKHDFEPNDFIGKNGRTRYYQCIKCRRASKNASHHKRKYGEVHRKYLENTREQRRLACRKWLENNKDSQRLKHQEYYKNNRAVILARSKEIQRKYKQRYKSAHLKRKYGITLDQYNDMLTSQNNSCAICKTPPGAVALAVDHCHTTGKVRGLLCSDCNTLLGLSGDDISILHSAAQYLNAQS